eukprot:2256369-Pleurochrysis_carterae.AAC.2
MIEECSSLVSFFVDYSSTFKALQGFIIEENKKWRRPLHISNEARHPLSHGVSAYLICEKLLTVKPVVPITSCSCSLVCSSSQVMSMRW